MRHQSRRRALTCAAATAVAVLAGGSLADACSAAHVGSAAARPCDIYSGAGTPCVAAYSTVRALYRSYNGPLYQVTRAFDGARVNIGVLKPGGFADAAAQDTFCAGVICTITRIYDQSPDRNDLGVGPVGTNGARDFAANASALPVAVDGHHVYGLYIQPGDGYRNDVTQGVAVGDQPQGAYMVTSAVGTNDRCCFDFGNAEASGADTGNGHMDAISFTSLRGAGADPNSSGPWVQADLENGLFASNGAGPGGNGGNTGEFVTAIVNSNGATVYAVKDGNAQSGGLTTDYSGPLPDLGGYVPLQQEGAIILGTGGDNSNQSSGFFFEGVLTAGFPSAATDNAIQANIVATGYQKVTPAP
ncbi:MAG TPA: arabinofuranosidase catalytic domain-containing protein [Trebonia sp.]|nr:arabinofuranosidase catalytic domain-containing protein [Trebonia sp.]